MSRSPKPCACGRCDGCVAVAMYLGGRPVADIEARAGVNCRELYAHLKARGIASSRRDNDDLTGRRFGALVVVEMCGKNPHGQTLWLCRCDCGGTREVKRFKLTGGRWRATACHACTERRLGRAAA